MSSGNKVPVGRLASFTVDDGAVATFGPLRSFAIRQTLQCYTRAYCLANADRRGVLLRSCPPPSAAGSSFTSLRSTPHRSARPTVAAGPQESGVRLQPSGSAERQHALPSRQAHCDRPRRWTVGRAAQRSKGGAMGAAHCGGHERSSTPRRPGPASKSARRLPATPTRSNDRNGSLWRTLHSDPSAKYAAVNSSPRSGRSHVHRGPRRCPRSSGHTEVGATQGD